MNGLGRDVVSQYVLIDRLSSHGTCRVSSIVKCEFLVVFDSRLFDREVLR